MARANKAIERGVSDYRDQVSLGRVPGVSAWNKFAYRSNVSTSAVFVEAGGTVAEPEILGSAETFSIEFNDTSDGDGSTGATELTIYYVDSSGDFQIGTHTLTGTSPDTTAFSGLGINRAAVSATGSGDINENAITITSSTSGGQQGYIPAGEGVTQQAIFYSNSGSGCVAEMLMVHANKLSGSSPNVTFKGWVYNRGVDSSYEIFRYIMDTSIENNLIIEDPVGFRLNPTDVLYFTAEGSSGSGIEVAVRFSLRAYA